MVQAIAPKTEHMTLGFFYPECQQVFDNSAWRQGFAIRYLGWAAHEHHHLAQYYARIFFIKHADVNFLSEGLTHPEKSWQRFCALAGLEVANAF
jgi:hypothetical protein